MITKTWPAWAAGLFDGLPEGRRRGEGGDRQGNRQGAAQQQQMGLGAHSGQRHVDRRDAENPRRAPSDKAAPMAPISDSVGVPSSMEPSNTQ